MDLLKRLLGSKVKSSADESMDAQDLPHLDLNIQKPSVERETDAIETAGIPSVNRRRGNSKMVTMGGFVTILGIGTVLFVSANPGKELKSKTLNEPERISNNLPPLTITPVTKASPVERYIVPAILQTEPQDQAKPHDVQPIALRERVAPDHDNSAPQSTGKPADWAARKMSGGLLVANNTSGSASVPGETSAAARVGGTLRSPLALTLEPTLTTGVSASILPDRNFLITKGTSLDCVLETALDSTLPGLTTCLVTRDVYSDNGQVLLMDRGSKVVGEYQGGLKQGQVRLGVLWTRLETPLGVVVSLDSPGTDALGRTGLEGWVDTHFAERFGAAILMSLLQDSVAAMLARQSPVSSGTVVVGSSAATAGEKIVEKMLDSTVNIAPTLVKNHGDHIQIMVARDLDFSSVYALRVKK